MIMKRFLHVAATVLALSLVSLPVSGADYYGSGDSLEDSAYMANRRTALRCLTLAKDYAAAANWNSVVSQVSMGISYDSHISDLWYMLAVAANNQGKTKAVVASYVERAINEAQWVDYNRDAARILYADILSDTLRYADVFAVLDGDARYSMNECYVNAPRIYSSDADYIRAKALYRLGDPASVEQARKKIDDARKMYPADIRFPILFFTYENPAVVNADMTRIARIFIAQILEHSGAYYDGHSAASTTEMEILAVPFADAQTRTYLLRSFSARGLRHPRYAILAQQYGLLTQKQALEYIEDFADSQISYDVLTSFLAGITDADVKKSAASYLKAYNGLIARDTDGDKIRNLYVQYERGRPQSVYYDRNQDGVYEWSIDCDFGTPVKGSVYSQRMDFTWGAFPSLRTVRFKKEDGSVDQSYSLVPGKAQWTPLRMVLNQEIGRPAGVSFYFPEINEGQEELGSALLLDAASSITVTSSERKDSTIEFIVLDGQIQIARYMQGNRQYAQAEFVNGVPSLRVVDSNGDGVYETTEFYGEDTTGQMETHSLEEEQTIMTNLFGKPSNGAGYYLRMIQIDTGKPDTISDFTEEYLPRGGKITSYDTNGDGSWDVRAVRQSRNAEDPSAPVVEEALFFDANNDLVRITSENGIPVQVTVGLKSEAVIEDDSFRFYWIGEKGSPALAKKALQTLNAQNTQGKSMIVSTSDGSEEALVIRIGELNCGKLIH